MASGVVSGSIGKVVGVCSWVAGSSVASCEIPGVASTDVLSSEVLGVADPGVGSTDVLSGEVLGVIGSGVVLGEVPDVAGIRAVSGLVSGEDSRVWADVVSGVIDTCVTGTAVNLDDDSGVSAPLIITTEVL